MSEEKEGSGAAPVTAETLPELKLRKTLDEHGQEWQTWNFYDIERHGPNGADDLSSYLGVSHDGKVILFKWNPRKCGITEIRIR